MTPKTFVRYNHIKCYPQYLTRSCLHPFFYRPQLLDGKNQTYSVSSPSFVCDLHNKQNYRVLSSFFSFTLLFVLSDSTKKVTCRLLLTNIPQTTAKSAIYR